MADKKKIPVVVDTREQRPWSFPAELFDAKPGTLYAGDYQPRDAGPGHRDRA
jgi:hypothetical protein